MLSAQTGSCTRGDCPRPSSSWRRRPGSARSGTWRASAPRPCPPHACQGDARGISSCTPCVPPPRSLWDRDPAPACSLQKGAASPLCGGQWRASKLLPWSGPLPCGVRGQPPPSSEPHTQAGVQVRALPPFIIRLCSLARGARSQVAPSRRFHQRSLPRYLVLGGSRLDQPLGRHLLSDGLDGGAPPEQLPVGDGRVEVLQRGVALGALLERLQVQPCPLEAATLCARGCNPMRERLQPCAQEAATLCVRGCNPVRKRLQPYA